jgi:hypothetical protein
MGEKRTFNSWCEQGLRGRRVLILGQGVTVLNALRDMQDFCLQEERIWLHSFTPSGVFCPVFYSEEPPL